MRKLFIGLLAICTISTAFAADNTPVGYWKTIDDVTGKVKSIIHITATANQTLNGQLVKIYPNKGESENDVCIKCSGANHNKPILGMVILTGMKKNAAMWEGGKVLDPSNGKYYRLTMKTVASGNKMEVHGYVGLPLFGRTQIWERTDTNLVDNRFK